VTIGQGKNVRKRASGWSVAGKEGNKISFFMSVIPTDMRKEILLPWWWRQCASLKCRSTSMRLHCATSQKAVIFRLLISDSDIRCSCWWGENVSLNCGNHWACCSSPRWYMSMEICGWMILAGENWNLSLWWEAGD
jgi:hypothetical protein